MLSRNYPFRAFTCIQLLLWVTYMMQNYFFFNKGKIDIKTYIIDAAVNLIYTIFLILISHTREMMVRKNYNYQRIIQVEIENTEENLGKLVPMHVLTGIKNDQKVVDHLDYVTIMYADIKGLDFSGKVNSYQAINEIHKIFCKFDQLCESISV